MKKNILFFAILMMTTSLMAQNFDFSATAPSGQTLYYKIMTPSTVSVVYPNYSNSDYWSGYTKPSGTLTIPSTVSNGGTTYTVTAVGFNAFYNCVGLEGVNMPTSLTAIGNYAYFGCTNLLHIVVPEGVTSVGEYAYNGCTLASDISLPSTLTTIGQRAFYGVSSITELTIPRNVQTIGSYAFANCSLLNTLNYNADSCSDLSSQTFPSNSLSTLNIGIHVKYIPAVAFAGLPISSVSFPLSVKSIGNFAFQNCVNLTSITWGNGVERIGSYAFSGCNSINSFSLPQNIKVIGTNAFQNIATIATVVIPPSLDSLGVYAFNNCPNLTTLVFNADSCVLFSNTTISMTQSPFDQCPHLTTVTFGSNVKSIPAALLVNRNIVTVNIPNSVKTIGDYAFTNSALQTVNFGNGLEKIGKDAFSSCSQISSLSLPSSLKEIDDNAFYGCTGLTAITIPQNMKHIGGGSFFGCSNLDTLFFNADSCELIGSGIYSVYNGVLYGPEYTSGMYAYRPSFQNLGAIFIGENVKAIPNTAFKDCRIKSISIPNSVRYIGIGAFVRCDSLTTITFGSGVDTIDHFAFRGCSSLTSVSLPQSLKYIGDNAFAYTGLTTITLPASLSSIGKYFLASSQNLASIYSLASVPPAISMYTFRCPASGCTQPSTLPLYVACTDMETYRNANHWSAFNNINLISGNYSVNVGTANAEFGTADYVTTDCENGLATIEAIPATHYRFTHWSDGNTDNPRSLTLTQDTVLTASFEPDTFVVSAVAEHDSMGTVIGSGTYFNGETASLFAYPNGGYVFSHWEDNSVGNPRTLVVTGDVSATAFFTLPPVDTIDIHDTTFVVDTVTEYLQVHDTTFFDVHDTIYIPLHDTAYITLTDTVTNTLFDTTYITLTDTVTNTIYDTITNTVYDTISTTVYDTIDNFIHDTTTVYVTDTLYLYDTVYLFDTVYIYDTVYVGVDDVEAVTAKVYVAGGQIVVESAEGKGVAVYDVAGRRLATRRDEYGQLRFDVSTSGIYLVRVGDAPARRVVVVR